jgi:manganese/zinc/iron transport system substrate-binding protein
VHHVQNRLFAILTAAVIALGATAAMAQERLEIVATTGMIADAAREVGGDLVQVSALMGPGVDPHAYRQTRSDIVATASAISSCGMGSTSKHRWKTSCWS